MEKTTLKLLQEIAGIIADLTNEVGKTKVRLISLKKRVEKLRRVKKK